MLSENDASALSVKMNRNNLQHVCKVQYSIIFNYCVLSSDSIDLTRSLICK